MDTLVDTLVSPENHWALWAILLGAAALGLWATALAVAATVCAVGYGVTTALGTRSTAICGTLGYATTTFIVVAVGHWLR